MPALADISTLKYDGVTAVVYNGVIAASGDKTPAIWRVNAQGTAINFRPELRVMSRANANNSARIVDYMYTYPEVFTNSTTGIASVNTRLNAKGTLVLPLEMADTASREGAYQFGNLMATALLKSIFASGYSAT